MTSIMPPEHSLSPTRVMAPPQAILILCQMELHLLMSPTYGFLAGAILAKGCRPDFNNGLTGDSNSGPFWAPGVYLSPTRIMALPQVISVLSYICSCLLLMVSWQVPYLVMGCRPDFNNGLIDDSNSGPILAPGICSSLTRIMAPPQAIPILNCKHELAQKLF